MQILSDELKNFLGMDTSKVFTDEVTKIANAEKARDKEWSGKMFRSETFHLEQNAELLKEIYDIIDIVVSENRKSKQKTSHWVAMKKNVMTRRLMLGNKIADRIK